MLQTTMAFPVHPAWKTGKPGAVPTFQRMPWKPVELPKNPNLGQSEGAVKAVALGALLLPTAAAAAISFVGFRLGSQDEDSWISALGYITGALGGIFTVMGLLAMMGVAVTPFNFKPQTTEISLPSAPATPAAPVKI